VDAIFTVSSGNREKILFIPVILSDNKGFSIQVSAIRLPDTRNSYETSEEWIRFYFFRQDLQDYQDFFGLVWLYPVHPACRGEAF
jgi:hypothetical protein